jgi:hypothetical protein
LTRCPSDGYSHRRLVFTPALFHRHPDRRNGPHPLDDCAIALWESLAADPQIEDARGHQGAGPAGSAKDDKQ